MPATYPWTLFVAHFVYSNHSNSYYTRRGENLSQKTNAGEVCWYGKVCGCSRASSWFSFCRCKPIELKYQSELRCGSGHKTKREIRRHRNIAATSIQNRAVSRSCTWCCFSLDKDTHRTATVVRTISLSTHYRKSTRVLLLLHPCTQAPAHGSDFGK